MIQIPLSNLRGHPMNSNAMPEESLKKLMGHIERTGRYPPLIVRPAPGTSGAQTTHPDLREYQVLDGHHRWAALRRLDKPAAWCVVWEVDDAEALVLLGTLNRLRGADDPRKRAELIAAIQRRCVSGCDAEIARLLPETREQVRKFLSLRSDPPLPLPPLKIGEMPTAVYFFLTGSQKATLDTALRKLGGKREEALMRLVVGEGPRAEKRRD